MSTNPLIQDIQNEEQQKTFFDLLAMMLRESGASELRFRENHNRRCWDVDFVYPNRRADDYHCSMDSAAGPSSVVIVNGLLRDMALIAGRNNRPVKAYRIHYAQKMPGFVERSSFTIVTHSEEQARKEVMSRHHMPSFAIERIEEVPIGKQS